MNVFSGESGETELAPRMFQRGMKTPGTPRLLRALGEGGGENRSKKKRRADLGQSRQQRSQPRVH